MANHRANIANVVEYIRNVDPEQFANIRDEVFEVLEEVNFEEIMDQEIDSDEEILSNDAGYASDLSERYRLCRKICAIFRNPCIDGRTKHCIIHCYYTTSGALSVCAACMIRLADTDITGLYLVRKHDIDYIDALNGRFCTNAECPHTLYFRATSAHIEKTIANSERKYCERNTTLGNM